ncbi:glycoside hydrolase family 99-like domain-containing protein [Paenibacillus sp. J5C_2022]|uniref:glycosyltransferase WbsX family protein n=1 Tax=Paenibacillus sp. J5C2022 TaxID=2977129 RepID=UPI0021D17A24|nr:glycoside hydrolase family 99-like domain-containing protein [Paenibacillus sp. J5C2022]MCU6712721.1 glycoside hydrolase family 99-like domain-containing protein [Paenibacillus sp. J5C2022]
MTPKVEIAAYYFPNYHEDLRNEIWHGKGWTEWDLVKRATPRFEGHEQPKIPEWGYEDESNPTVMERKIAAAADHGLTSFIFDWYWYEDGPYLNKALEKGFLGAANVERLKFCLMWANHDWSDIHPAPRNKPYHTLAKGAVSKEAFVAATDYMIENYFSHPSYMRVNGGLYFSIYELMSLIKGIGGSLEITKEVLNDFRARVHRAGLGELHLNAVVWGIQNLPGEELISDVNGYLDKLGFDSITSYVWIHHNEMPDFPCTDYAVFREMNILDFKLFTDRYSLPYFPNVTVGWDPSPRTIQSDRYDNIGYPFTPILSHNTPAEFKKALEAVKHFMESSERAPSMFTINAWNEWTEGSYLEPDTVYGMQYLQAIKEVFLR